MTLGDLSCDSICDPDDLEMQGDVCGSDGKTYDDTCALKKAVCESKKAVTVVHQGMHFDFNICLIVSFPSSAVGTKDAGCCLR